MNSTATGAQRRGMAAMGAAALGALLLLAGEAVAQPSSGQNSDFTSEFRIQDCDFETRGANPYFILRPGRQLVLESDEELLFITVLRRTRDIRLVIDGERRTVTTRVIEEREFEKTDEGLEIKEISRNFFAICDETNDVYYFGEDVDIFEDGEVVSHDGAWLAGRDTGEGVARPGIIMPGTFLLGSRYFQELAPGVALDRAEHTRMGLTVEVPFGELEGCVEVIETSPLEPGSTSRKVYAPGIGLIVDGDLELVDVIDDVYDDDD